MTSLSTDFKFGVVIVSRGQNKDEDDGVPKRMGLSQIHAYPAALEDTP